MIVNHHLLGTGLLQQVLLAPEPSLQPLHDQYGGPRMEELRADSGLQTDKGFLESDGGKV